MVLAWGSLLGLISVIFGAFAQHTIHHSVTSAVWGQILTALRYNEMHAIVLVAIGIAMIANERLKSFKILWWSAIAFFIGTCLFSFSIYLKIVTGSHIFKYIPPFGGISLIIGWVLLFFSAFQMKSR